MLWLRKLGRWVSVSGLSVVVLLVMMADVWAQVSPANFVFTGSARPTRKANFRPILQQKGVQVGPIQLHPFLGFAEIYTDNVFRTNSSRKSDFIHTIAPGIQALMKLGPRHRFVLDYRASQLFHQRFAENDALSLDASGRLALDFPGGLTVDLQGGHVEGFDPRGSEVDIQAPDITTWNTNTFIGRIRWAGTATGIEFTGRLAGLNFENNNQALTRDRLMASGDLVFSRAIGTRTFGLLSLGVDRVTYDRNTQLDGVDYQIGTGIRLDGSGRINGEIQFGYEFLNFDHAQVTQPAGSPLSSGGKNLDLFFVFGDVSWKPTARFTLSVNPFRTLKQGAVFGGSIYTRTGINMRAKQVIGVRTQAIGGFNVNDTEYFDDPENRRDLRFGGLLGLEYQAIHWLGVRVDYRFQKRNSNINQFDFYANTFMVSIQGML